MLDIPSPSEIDSHTFVLFLQNRMLEKPLEKAFHTHKVAAVKYNVKGLTTIIDGLNAERS
jgi:dihydroorotase